MFEDKTPEAIKAAIKAELQTDLETREGGFVDDMLGPTALELYKVYGSLESLRSMVWVDESSGEYLDLAAEDIGIEPRKEGSRARVTLWISGTPGHTVPAGETFYTVDNLYFDTVEAQSIPEDGIAAIEAQARESGVRYNVAAGEIVYQYSNSAHITEVTNPEAAQGGADSESDASLYARIVQARQKPRTSGNVHDYEAWALEVSGVGAAKVFPTWDGPGTVKVLIGDERAQPVDEAIVAACAAHIEEVRPIGAAVTVAGVEAFEVNVTATVRVQADADPAAVEETFITALEEYFRGVALAQSEVLYNRVGALLMVVDGVIDCEALALNGRAESLPLTEEQAPVVGEVAITCV